MKRTVITGVFVNLLTAAAPPELRNRTSRKAVGRYDQVAFIATSDIRQFYKS